MTAPHGLLREIEQAEAADGLAPAKGTVSVVGEERKGRKSACTK